MKHNNNIHRCECTFFKRMMNGAYTPTLCCMRASEKVEKGKENLLSQWVPYFNNGFADFRSKICDFDCLTGAPNLKTCVFYCKQLISKNDKDIFAEAKKDAGGKD